MSSSRLNILAPNPSKMNHLHTVGTLGTLGSVLVVRALTLQLQVLVLVLYLVVGRWGRGLVGMECGLYGEGGSVHK